MKKIFWQSMLPMVLWMIAACKKEKETVEKSPVQLLTVKEWTLFSVGFDDNNNGVIDINEEMIKDCQRDNTIKFNSDGRGQFLDKGISCGGPMESSFGWKFINNHTGIEIEASFVSVLKLDENEFIYTPELDGVTTKFIIRYRH